MIESVETDTFNEIGRYHILWVLKCAQACTCCLTLKKCSSDSSPVFIIIRASLTPLYYIKDFSQLMIECAKFLLMFREIM